jgi:hypothetical protein
MSMDIDQLIAKQGERIANKPPANDAPEERKLQDWQQRVIAEKRELDGRIHQLKEFLDSEAFQTKAGPGEAILLIWQHQMMTQYSMVLEMRIGSWGPHEADAGI